METKYCVYKITNKINGKIYIGKTAMSGNKRFRKHIMIAVGGKGKYPRLFFALHAAINKYGVENFSFERIEELSSEEESFQRETFWVNHYKEIGTVLYNLTIGGEGPSGRKPSKEAKQKMSLAHQKPGYKAGRQKLIPKQVIEIKKIIMKKNLTIKEIARMFGVERQTIKHICTGKMWEWVKVDGFIPTQQKYSVGPTYAKLSEESVREIKRLLENNELTQKQIAEKFGVREQTITLINTGKRWSHVK